MAPISCLLMPVLASFFVGSRYQSGLTSDKFASVEVFSLQENQFRFLVMCDPIKGCCRDENKHRQQPWSSSIKRAGRPPTLPSWLQSLCVQRLCVYIEVWLLFQMKAPSPASVKEARTCLPELAGTIFLTSY